MSAGSQANAKEHLDLSICHVKPGLKESSSSITLHKLLRACKLGRELAGKT